MSTQQLAVVAAELAKLAPLKSYIPIDVMTAITARTASFVQPQVAVSLATQTPTRRHPALVMRPGIPPRPLDSFFFEINHELP